MLQNGIFSEGWETLPAIREANFLRNQRPHGWQLEWLPIGASLFGDPNTKVGGIPECVHKLSKQLPPHEHLGQPNALILAGDTVYKIFSASAPFGATLSQTVTNLSPGSTATLTVPIQVHLRGETDPYGAESGVWINGEGGWVHGFKMGDRRWYEHKIRFTIPANGEADIVIRVKSKWPRGKDFFLDGITLEAETAVSTPPPPPQVIMIHLPENYTLVHVKHDSPNVVQVTTPNNVEIQLSDFQTEF